MSRLLTVAFVILVVLVTTIGGMWYLSYGVESVPSRATVSGLSAQATVHRYTEEGLPTVIQAASDADLLRALGYAQAQEMAFTLLLWRQVAQARLGAWLGASALPLDRHAARLGFSRGTDSLIAALPEGDRALLEAFAQGVNAGLHGQQRRDRFVALLGIEIEPFAAQDVLAIERMFAWSATTVAWPDSVNLPPEARHFITQDSLLRHTLGVFGWPESAGWTASDSTSSVLTARWVVGHAALPVVHESILVTATDSTLTIAIPGTPFPLLSARTAATAVFPAGRLQLQPATPRRWVADHTSLQKQDGGTFVERVWRDRDALLLRGDTSTASWEVAWTGLEPQTDASTWLSLLQRSSASATVFELVQAQVLSSEGGSGEGYVAGVLAASESARPWLRLRLDSLAASRTRLEDWFRDTQSAWAAEAHQRAAALLDSALLEQPHHRLAYEYLINWSGDLGGASIGATVFETFIQTLGLSPSSTPLPDTSQYFAAVRYTTAFAAAADTVVARHGPDPLEWRWEHVHPETRYFPLWAAPESLRLDLRRPRALASFQLPGEGHPTALRWLDPTNRQASAVYVAVVVTGSNPRWKLHRLKYDAARPFARYQTGGRRVQPLEVAYPSSGGHLITLLPGS